MLARRDAAIGLGTSDDRPASRPIRLGLAIKLALAFVGLVGLVLAVSGGLDMWLGYRQAEHVAVLMQQEKARDAAARIEEFLSDIEHQLGWTTPLRWNSLPLEQRRYDFIRLLREEPAISEIAEIDGAGKEQLKLSRTAPDAVASGADFARNPRFVEAEANGVWFSPVYFRNQSEPYMTIAVAHAGHHGGVTVAEVNLKFIWDLVNAMQVGRSGYAYVVDRRGRLIADPDLSLVLRDTDWSHEPAVAAALANLFRGAPAPGSHIAEEPDGRKALTTYAPVPRLDWVVFVEMPLREALAPVYASLYRVAALLVLGLLLAAGLGTMLARRMVVPIRRLQDGADRLGSGERSEPIEIHTGDEIEILAERFNQMAAKIREIRRNPRSEGRGPHRGAADKRADRARGPARRRAGARRSAPRPGPAGRNPKARGTRPTDRRDRPRDQKSPQFRQQFRRTVERADRRAAWGVDRRGRLALRRSPRRD